MMTTETIVPSRATATTPQLHLTRHRLSFEVEGDLLMPCNQGSLWRSAFGRELSAISESDDAACLATYDTPSQEIYARLFETRLICGDSGISRISNAPHPFVIAAPWTTEPVTIAKGSHISLEITLIGRSSQTLPAVVAAFDRAGQNGLGDNIIKARLLNVEYIPIALRLPTTQSQVRVAIDTPLQLLKAKEARNGSKHPRRFVVSPTNFRAHFLMSSLVRRMSMLMAFHMDTNLDKALMPNLMAACHRVRLMEIRLDFHKSSRWSVIQKRWIRLDGLTGEITLDLSCSASLWPYLWLGQFIHTGRHTTEGLGAYRVLPL